MTSSLPYNETMLQEHEETPKAKRALLVDATGAAISATNKLPVEASITVEDIEIGAVELKNAADDTRAVVKTDGTDNALVVVQNTVPTTTVTGSVDVGTVTTLPQTKVEVVTPLGTTCEDETNTAVLIGVKGSVAYDNADNVFQNKLYGYDLYSSTVKPLSAADLSATNPVTWTEWGFFPAAISDVTNYAYSLCSDESSRALHVNLVDSVSRKMTYLPMDDSNVFAWTENGIGGYTVSDSTYYTRPFVSDENTYALLTQTIDTTGNKQVFTDNGEVPSVINGGHGAVDDTSITLTVAATAYGFPSSPPTNPYLLIVYNPGAVAIYLRFTTGTTLGFPIAPGQTISIDMGANAALYGYCGTAAQILNYSTRANY